MKIDFYFGIGDYEFKEKHVFFFIKRVLFSNDNFILCIKLLVFILLE